MEKNVTVNDGVIELSRGGYLVDTPAGYIQFGSPPETIKDTMSFSKGVPRIFVLSSELFNWLRGISIGEIEFPIYYNFFFKKKKTYVICRRDQFTRMKQVLQESIFGPRNLDISIDFDNSNSGVHIPEIASEMAYFRAGLKLSDLVAFGIFEENRYTFKGVTINCEDDGSFTLSGEGGFSACVPGRISYKAQYKIGERLPEPYIPPLFGVTCLGPSHGFDPEENTSGYIIWLNHQGVMVDPPVNSTEWLESSNVSSKFIDSIILTHCHADHDAGTFQKILEEGKITVYSTETVMMSFLRKYGALSNVSTDYLLKLFNFHPLKIGKPVFIHGARFDMFYTLHSIPALGFKMQFQDQTFVYSSDHNNDPEVHDRLLNEGHISRERYDELRNFPWDSRVIYHESGVPPLHTPVKYLNSLPEEIQKKIVVYHIAKKDFPEDTHLKLARFGIEHTLYFDTQPPPFEATYQILSILKNLDLFTDITLSKVQDFFNILEREEYKKGEVIIRKGTKGDKFYIIQSGNISVVTGGLEEKKIYGAYEYFGEVALVSDQERAADVIAETDIVVYTISRDKFLNFITGTEFEKTLLRLTNIRSSETWNLLSTSEFFQSCTSSQKTWLESIFIPMEEQKAGVLIREGEPIIYVYIIRDGEVKVSRKGTLVATLKKGDFVGSVQNVYDGKSSGSTYSHDGPVSLYAMKQEDILSFLNSNPGMLMKLAYDF